MSILNLSRRVKAAALFLGVFLVLAVSSFGWWAAGSIDNEAIQRQSAAVMRGLSETEQSMVVEQDNLIVWDYAVRSLLEGNNEWVADNLAEGVSRDYGYNRVYILEPSDRPFRAASEGVGQPNEAYERDRAVVDPLVRLLRVRMADASAGQSDSTRAITGLGEIARAELGDGSVGIISVRPIVPMNSTAVAQAPGAEYLHVAIRIINEILSAEIAERFDLVDLRFEGQPSESSDRAHVSVSDGEGRILGFFTWQPYRPALQLLKNSAPILIGSMLIMALVVGMLLRRLDRTSTRLEISEAEAHRLAFYDQLVGTPNRALFHDRLERAIANRRRSGANLALHSIDLDRFKQVNDTLGHPAGDELLRQVAARLSLIVSEVDTVARLGGDEFALVQFDVADADAAVLMGQKIVDALQRPFDLNGHEALIGACVGIIYSDDPAHEMSDLIRYADIALYEAKAKGRGRYQLFGGELDRSVRARMALEHDLREALQEQNGLELAYQPIYGAADGGIVGAEALVRWNHPTKGRLAPDTFISLAEERGLINALGFWVLREALLFAKTSQVRWVAVNVSPIQFHDDRFGEQVLSLLSELGVAPQRLEIEITEGLLLQNSPIIQQTLRMLRSAGIRVALDDFGTGYSSISYLRTYGVDKLKIDQSFVAQLGRDTEIDSIVRSIINLASAMRMMVTAEGVETSAQKAMLVAMGCGQLQGYLLSKPIAPAALNELIEAETVPASLLAV